MVSATDIRRRAESNIKRDKLSGADADTVRLEAESIIREMSENRLLDVVKEEREAQSGSLIRRAAGTAGAAALNLADTALFGRLPQAVGALGGDEEAVDTALQATQITNPGAAAAGSFGSFFTPAGPAGLVGKTLAKGAIGAGGRAAQAVAPKAVQSLEKAFAGRAATAIATNLTGSAAALTGIRTLEQREGEGLQLQDRITDAMKDISSPVNLGLVTAFGAAGARVASGDPALVRLGKEFTRITGQNVPAGAISNTEGARAFWNTALKTPGLSTAVGKVRDSLTKSLVAAAESVGTRRGLAKGQEARAARGIQKLVGDPKASPPKPGVITAERRAGEAAAIAAEGGNVVSPSTLECLNKALAVIEKKRPTTSDGGEFQIVARALRKAVKAAARGEGEETSFVDPSGRKIRTRGKPGRPVTVRELEDLRQKTADVAWGPAGNQAKVEAAQFYEALRLSIARDAPAFSRSLETGRQLRVLEESLAGVEPVELAAKQMASFFSSGAKKIMTRIDTLERNSDPQDVDAVRGWFFQNFLSTKGVVRADGTLDGGKMKTLWGANGKFNAQIFDRLLPGAREELAGFGELGKAFGKTVLQARGSETSTVAARLATGTGALAALTGMFVNPMSGIITILGPMGAKAAIKSIVQGKLGQTIAGLEQGGQLAPPVRAALGAQSLAGQGETRQGPAAGIARGGIAAGKESLGLGVDALRGLVQ
jgi:hypothetical protein